MRAHRTITAIALLALGAAGCCTLAPSFKTDLSATLNGAKDPLSECYRQALERNPNLSGTLALALKVKRQSTAISAVSVLERPGTDAALDQCIVGVVSGLAVPKAPKVNVTAEYPLTLTPAAP